MSRLTFEQKSKHWVILFFAPLLYQIPYIGDNTTENSQQLQNSKCQVPKKWFLYANKIQFSPDKGRRTEAYRKLFNYFSFGFMSENAHLLHYIGAVLGICRNEMKTRKENCFHWQGIWSVCCKHCMNKWNMHVDTMRSENI